MYMEDAYKGCLPTSPFLITRSTTSKGSKTKLEGPYACGTVAFEPRLSAEKTAGTSGELYVISLNIARLVPSSIVANKTSNSIVLVTTGWASLTTGTREKSAMSWYWLINPRFVIGADKLYVIEDVISAYRMPQ